MDRRAPSSVSFETVEVDGTRLEYEWALPVHPIGRTLVLLHEGLGCIAMWRDFPKRVADDTGARVLVYSRQGYGGSAPIPLPRPLTYMHDEGQRVLPALLERLGIEDAVLVGHSDGASIALVYAGSGLSRLRTRGLVLLAPHVFCEEVSVTSIREARAAFADGSLRAKLARYHGDNTDCAFWGWNDAWLDPAFRQWNLEGFLPNVHIPVLVIQGADDRYGTLAQVDAIERGLAGSFQRVVLEACGHDPAREASEPTRRAIADFVSSVPLLASPLPLVTSAP